MSRLERQHHDLRFEIGFASQRGKRPDNQDFAAVRVGRPRIDARRATVAAVADGVGGAKGGREAAELTVAAFSTASSTCRARSAFARRRPARSTPSIPGSSRKAMPTQDFRHGDDFYRPDP